MFLFLLSLLISCFLLFPCLSFLSLSFSHSLLSQFPTFLAFHTHLVYLIVLKSFITHCSCSFCIISPCMPHVIFLLVVALSSHSLFLPSLFLSCLFSFYFSLIFFWLTAPASAVLLLFSCLRPPYSLLLLFHISYLVSSSFLYLVYISSFYQSH